MEIIRVEPKDINIIIEFSLSELKSLFDGICMCNIVCDKSIEEDRNKLVAVQDFCNVLSELFKDINNVA